MDCGNKRSLTFCSIRAYHSCHRRWCRNSDFARKFIVTESGVRSQESGVRSQESGVRSQEEERRRKKEGGRKKKEERRKKEEGRRKKEEGENAFYCQRIWTLIL
ncbi:MAG: hypothetical protein PX483_05130 [Nostocales cyanobacterium LE14-WE4]|uniref:hypothetical protein n=1 Tax=Anabaena sp. AL09 TaxID=1710891 RepID=UPI00262D6F2F|nr:hypothetical protein [Anabaena sp. AL09]MCE2702386.1 hypothetical protein [Anabaena sp. 49633_E8]MDJ0500235.1 hypothetical protein [Nostocales cyanobacterium LE14-WE4]